LDLLDHGLSSLLPVSDLTQIMLRMRLGWCIRAYGKVLRETAQIVSARCLGTVEG
jgi:hypothetical protein